MNDSFTPTTRPPVSDSLISVVVPLFNEADVLVELCQRMRAALTSCRTTFEIIFVDDGSRDNTGELLDSLARQFEDVSAVHLSRNFGHQAAIHAGLSHARGDAVVLMDGDLQDPPEAIEKFLEAWQAGYDVAYAIRVGRKEWLGKRMLFAGFHRVLSSISQTAIPVDAGNFGLIDARVVRTLLTLAERDRYLPGLRSWVGFKQVGIPVERASRYDHHPRVSLRGLLRLAKTAIFSFSSLPLAIFAWIGWLALAAFIGVSGCSLYCKYFTDLAIPGWTSQLVAMTFFAALNALGISMLGEYVVRIYDQVRGRPLYLIDRTVNFAKQASAESKQQESTATAGNSMDLDALDPLHLDPQWDDAYQHLLEQANDLLELGELARAEADEFAATDAADRQFNVRTGENAPIGPPEVENESIDEMPHVVQFCGPRNRR